MSATIEAVTNLAQNIASIVPPVPTALRADTSAHRRWENLMLEAGHGIAAVVGHDRDLLLAAIGPDIEVGVNPSWRALLEIALIVSTPASEVFHQVDLAVPRLTSISS